MGEKLTFLKTFLQQPSNIGAIAPSSVGLVSTMIESFDWENVQSAIEYGPGTGVFTERILKTMQEGTHFFAIEQSATMVEATLQRCPEVKIYQESVTNVQELCLKESIQNVDAIISGLPWASFPDDVQNEIMQTMTRVLRPGGTFATFAYWQGLALPAGQRFASRLRSTFSRVQRSPTVWKNLPPAFVYRCTL
ncbi:MAG: methyltransferase domain-containing protein [Planctomycetota bacterium]|nr:methyltransferase domain-containing protein [Planctomycetota bacterium]